MENSRRSLKHDGGTMAIISKPKPLMLKDFLRRDDLSSCSSNGFRSFPRKQCCSTTTIRLLLEIDLKSSKPKPKPKPPSSSSCNRAIERSRSKAASATVSALHRASVKFVNNAVKLLPLPSVRSPSVKSNGVKRGWFFPRTLSRKLFKRSFWKKEQLVREEKESNNNEKEIKRWRLFREFLEEKEHDHQQPPLDQGTPQTTLSHRVSTSWGSSDFTSELLSSSSSSSSSSSTSYNSGRSMNENDAAVVVEKKDEEIGVGEKEGAAGSEEDQESAEVATPSSNTKSEVIWSNEAKEQFSPVSILDCPFKDDEEISLGDSLPCTEGTKPKLMSKFSLCARLDQLEPIDLEKRIAASELDNGLLSFDYRLRTSAISKQDQHKEGDEENEIISAIMEELLSATKMRNPSSCDHNVVNLLSDFFIEKLEENSAIPWKSRRELDKPNQGYLLKVAEDWLNGQHQELFLGWEVEDERKVYLRDMEKGKKWRNFNGELEEVALDLEVEIWDSLMEEVFVV